MIKMKSLDKFISLFVALNFLITVAFPVSLRAELALPAPTQFVPLSKAYSFPVLKGIKFNSREPLSMEFILDTGNAQEASKEEAGKLIKYFLAGLTISEKDIWVNLSPYEKERIAPPALAETDLGKGLLSQDYLLKQLSASVTHPESQIGKDFWTQVYEAISKFANNSKFPVNAFNRIWIVPNKAVVYENQNVVFVTESTLKALLEEDFLALQNVPLSQRGKEGDLTKKINQASSEVMRSFILPKINQEINIGKNFATLRQIYNSLILAIWFKRKFKDSLYQYYINQDKTKGIDLADKTAKDKIYNLYVEAFSKGIYNYTKTDTASNSQKIKRRYFSGGFMLGSSPLDIAKAPSLGENPLLGGGKIFRARLNPLGKDGSLLNVESDKKSSSPMREEEKAVIKNTAREIAEFLASRVMEMEGSVIVLESIFRAPVFDKDMARNQLEKILKNVFLIKSEAELWREKSKPLAWAVQSIAVKSDYDIPNVLTPVVGYAEMLKDFDKINTTVENRIKTVKIMKSQIMRLQSVIEALLDIRDPIIREFTAGDISFTFVDLDASRGGVSVLPRESLKSKFDEDNESLRLMPLEKLIMLLKDLRESKISVTASYIPVIGRTAIIMRDRLELNILTVTYPDEGSISKKSSQELKLILIKDLGREVENRKDAKSSSSPVNGQQGEGVRVFSKVKEIISMELGIVKNNN